MPGLPRSNDRCGRPFGRGLFRCRRRGDMIASFGSDRIGFVDPQGAPLVRRFVRHGIARTVRLFLVVAALGTLAVFAPSTTTTTVSAAATMPGDMAGADQCVFATFCDAFQTKFPGGRAGDLDESKWSFSRLSQETNAS